MFQYGTEVELRQRDKATEALTQVVRAAYVHTNRRIPGLIDAGFIHTQEYEAEKHVVFGFVIDRTKLRNEMSGIVDEPNFFVHLQMLQTFYLAYAYFARVSGVEGIYENVAILHFDRGNLRRVIETRADIRAEKTWLIYNRLDLGAHRKSPVQLRRLATGEMCLPDLLREARPILHTKTNLRNEGCALNSIYAYADQSDELTSRH